MDWHADENAHSSSFYPSRGRRAKKFAGSPCKTILFRQLQNKHVIGWLCKYQELSGFMPSRDTALRRIDGRRMGGDLRIWNGDGPVSVERVQPKTPGGETVLSKVQRQIRLKDCGIPIEMIQRVAEGKVTSFLLAQVYGMTDERAAGLVLDYQHAISLYGEV